MQLKEDIRIASFDLDDTLLVHGQLSDKNKEALIKLHDCGCKIVINTGRGLRFVPESCRQDYVDYIIVSNGSRIFDNHSKQFIKNITIDPDDVIRIFSLIEKQHAVKLMCDETTYTSKDMYPFYTYLRLRNKGVYGFKLAELLDFFKNFTPRKDIKQFVYSKPEVFKMECHIRKGYSGEEIVEKINDTTKTHAVIVKGESIEVASIEAGKGKSLIYLADMLDVKKENIAAFGDSGNDIDALQTAGYAIAVSNATDKIKQVANIVIGQAKDDGVAEYINSIIE